MSFFSATRLAATLPATCLASMLLGGCASAEIPAMRKAEGPLPSGSPDSATVFFVRPDSACDTSTYPTVVDESEHFMGSLAPSSTFAVRVSPGEHIFVAWPSLDERVAKYPDWKPVGVVRVAPRAGDVITVSVTSPEGGRLRCPRYPWFVLERRATDEPEVARWIAAANRFEPDAAAGDAEIAKRRELVDAYFAMAKEKLAARDARNGARERSSEP